MSDEHVDEVSVRDFFYVSSTLIHFAKFDPAKLVRFELTDSTNHPVTCKRESVVHDTDSDTYSQVFFPRKESEEELMLHAAARVHSKGQVGAFQSVITLPASAEEAFDTCMTRHSTDVAVIKLNVSDSQDIRVVLCSTQKKKLSLLVDDVLKRELREEVVDWKGSQITRCHLTMRAPATKPLGTVLSLRLFYKWESEAIFLDSKDFVAHADSSAERACTPEVRLIGPSESLMPDEAAALALPWNSDDGHFPMESFASQQIQSHRQIQCNKIEYHWHQTNVTSHNCMVGDQTTLNTLPPTISQRSLEAGPSSAPHRSITEGTSPQE
ncbi:hypothetical protein OS493_034490 [Desmophyllum pertusum]|uniref:Uncharacterized protein n=1 Tax=Desmophyllum pertusum TaxID=174260 RepID=A0A9X0CNA8_9CNID|nr:hypothetical protein OS493_034490 [Desmophyllum pertusum]